MTPEEEDIVRARQRSRARVTGLALVALAVLFYLITIVKMGMFG